MQDGKHDGEAIISFSSLWFIFREIFFVDYVRFIFHLDGETRSSRCSIFPLQKMNITHLNNFVFAEKLGRMG